MVMYREYWNRGLMQRNRRHILPFTHDFHMVSFFDGAAKNGTGGSGFVLYINKDHIYHGWTGLATCTNNLSEFTAVWLLLYWAHRMDIRELKIYGDSQLVIGWLQGKIIIKAVSFSHQCSRIKELMKLFGQIQIGHIYREHNMEVDTLSKLGIGCTEGILQVEEVHGGSHKRNYEHRIY